MSINGFICQGRSVFPKRIVWVQQDHQYFDTELGTHHSRCFLCFLFLPTSARPPVPKFLRWSHSMCPKYKQQVCLEQSLLAASVLYLRIEGGDGLLILQILNPSVICRALPSLAPLPSAKPEPSGPTLPRPSGPVAASSSSEHFLNQGFSQPGDQSRLHLLPSSNKT